MKTYKANSEYDALKQAQAEGVKVYAAREIGTTGYYRVYTFEEFEKANLFTYCR